MQETPGSKAGDSGRDNFQQAAALYQPLVQRLQSHGRLLDGAAMLLANLCVAHIMNEENSQAEEVMKQLEREEAALRLGEPDKQARCACHLCQLFMYRSGA